jgi:hypothetical protein
VPDSISKMWEVSALQETAALFGGSGADAEIPSEARFLRAAARLLRRRTSREGSGEDPTRLAVIVLETLGRDDPFLDPFELVPMLDQGVVPLNSRLWLTNVGVTFGHFLNHELNSAEVFAWVIGLGLGDKSTIVFDPSVDGGELRFYRNGLADMGEVKSYPIAYVSAVSYKDVKAVIDLVWLESLASPQHQLNHVSTWKKPSAHWASSNAESVVQSQLRIGLKMAFLFCEVSKEGPVASGRFDLTLSFTDAVTQAKSCYGVLELKVFRSYGSTGIASSEAETLAAAADGLTQAYSYRDDLGAVWAALCCFDLRKDDDEVEACFSSIRTEAIAHDVSLSRWRLFNTVKAFREARKSS